MKKILLSLLIFLLLTINCFASAPTRPNSYVSGTTIDPVAVTLNETTLYSYLQSGVDTFATGSIANSSISNTAGITYGKLNLSGGIVPGDFNTSLTASVYQLENLLIPGGGTFNLGSAVNGNTLYNNGTSYVNVAVGTQGQAWVSNGTIPQWGQQPYVKVSEQEASGTSAGTATAGTWQTRVLNTKESDTSTIASLCTGNGVPVVTCTGANQIVLPAGTYHVNALSPYSETNQLLTRLQNITANTTLLMGTSGYAATTVSNITTSFIFGNIILASPSALSVQFQIGTTGALGQQSSLGTEVYTIAEFTKVG